MRDSQEKKGTLTELVFPVRSNGAGGHRKFFQAPDKKSSVTKALLAIH